MHYRVSSSRKVGARPAQAYAAIADYRHHHPHIVPPGDFLRLDVLAGGYGAGTRTRVEMRLLGAKSIFEQTVSEPEPGRVLVESNTDGSGVTTFTVDDAGDGRSAQVTIATDLPLRPGLRGRLERWLVSLALRRVYNRELALLASYAPGIADQVPAGHARPDAGHAAGPAQ